MKQSVYGLMAMLFIACCVLFVPPSASAATDCTSVAAAKEKGCTSFAELACKMDSGETGLLTEITNYIKTVVGGSTKKLYEAFTGSTIYRNAVIAAMTLMVTIYGVGFLIGVTQASFGEVLMRLIKMGFIFTLIAPNGAGWSFFNNIAVKFFNDGTDEIIRKVMEIGTGHSFAAGDSPFSQLDGLANFVLSPDMVIAMMGSTFASGPYGLTMGALIGVAVMGLLKMLLDALKTYALSFIMRSLLLGMAPLFIVFLLFERTKGLFSGWLNMLINQSLQPILYFTFISFFMVMIMGAAKDMMGYKKDANGEPKSLELCWTEFSGGASGTDNKTSFWRFKYPGEPVASSEQANWMGAISCQLNDGKDSNGEPCPAFPINIVDLLTFLVLVYVAQRFSQVVDNIANEISNASVSLDKSARFDMKMAEAQAKSGNKTGAGQP